MVDEQTGEVVEGDDKSRGYEIAKGKYVEIDPDEIKAIQVESTHTLDSSSFVPVSEIDRRYFERPYYIAPDGGWSFGNTNDGAIALWSDVVASTPPPPPLLRLWRRASPMHRPSCRKADGLAIPRRRPASARATARQGRHMNEDGGAHK